MIVQTLLKLFIIFLLRLFETVHVNTVIKCFFKMKTVLVVISRDEDL